MSRTKERIIILSIAVGLLGMLFYAINRSKATPITEVELAPIPGEQPGVTETKFAPVPQMKDSVERRLAPDKRVQELEAENELLKSKVEDLEEENQGLKRRVAKLEVRSFGPDLVGDIMRLLEAQGKFSSPKERELRKERINSLISGSWMLLTPGNAELARSCNLSSFVKALELEQEYHSSYGELNSMRVNEKVSLGEFRAELKKLRDKFKEDLDSLLGSRIAGLFLQSFGFGS